MRGEGARRGRSAQVSGASLFTYVGEHPPEHIAAWTFWASTGRSDFDVAFDPSGEACTVWIAAYYFNRRNEAGPTSDAVSVNLPAGTVVPMSGRFKLAA